MDLMELLNWRYATRRWTPRARCRRSRSSGIVDAARIPHRPSSGLQPFEILVVTNAELKARIKQPAYRPAPGGRWVTPRRVRRWDNYTAERINRVFDNTNDRSGRDHRRVRGTGRPCWPSTRRATRP